MIGQSVSCEYFTHIPGLNDYLSTTRQENTHCYFTRLNLKKKLAAEKKDSKNGAARKNFGPSYFVTALEKQKVLLFFMFFYNFTK